MKYIIEDTTLSNIADAIRSKTGDTAEYTPAEMPAKIEAIETGSGGGGSGTGGGYTTDYIYRAIKNGDKSINDLLSDIDNGVWVNGIELFYNDSNLDCLQTSGKNLKLTDCHSMFQNTSGANLKNLDVSKFDTSKVLDFYQMFYNTRFSSIDLTGMKFYEARDLTNMFYNNTSLTEVTLDFTGAQKIENLTGLFRKCTDLEKINGLENLDTSKVENMSYMFSEIQTYLDVDISNFVLQDQSSACDMEYMFYKSYIKSITFPSSGEGKFAYMFNEARVKELVDMGNLNLSSKVSTVSSFLNTAQLYKGIILPGFPKLNSSLTLGNSNTKVYSIKFGPGKTFGSESATTLTLSLVYNWKGLATDTVPADFGGKTYGELYEEFANSIAPNESGKTRTIKLYTSFYNSLSDEQKALLTGKGYTLSYGTT